MQVDKTEKHLLSPAQIGSISLKNHVVMAPMTRCRALGNVPNALMAEYYKQRSGAGLIITEGTSPSKNGLGYARIPGIFNQAQVAGWKNITAAVHEGGSKIFIQLMHTGRISHPLNMPADAKILAPSAVKAAGQMWTDTEMMQDHPVPEAMTAAEIAQTKEEYVIAAKNALEAGFDGVELHGANEGLTDLVAFGRPWLNNPDLVARFEHHWPLSQELDSTLLYSADEKGYTDYPVYG